MWGQLSTTFSNVLKQPNGELLVAVDHNQLRTMVSETVDPIDWSHPPPSWAALPERHVHSINQCNLSGTCTCNRSVRGNHFAYAATLGMVLWRTWFERLSPWKLFSNLCLLLIESHLLPQLFNAIQSNLMPECIQFVMLSAICVTSQEKQHEWLMPLWSRSGRWRERR